MSAVRLERTREALAIADRRTDAFAAALAELEQAESALAAAKALYDRREEYNAAMAAGDRNAAFTIGDDVIPLYAALGSALAAFGSGEGDTT